MPPSLLSDAALVTLDRPTPARADLRTDAMLLTRGRAGTEPLIAAALLIDAVRSGHLDVLEGRRVVAGRHAADEPPLLADLRARVLAAAPGSPARWIERTAEFAPHRIATELVAAGIAMPLSPRFQRALHALGQRPRRGRRPRPHRARPGPRRPPLRLRPAHRRPAPPDVAHAAARGARDPRRRAAVAG